MDNILRAFTFWIRIELRDECREYLEGVQLRDLAAAPGNRRAAALFRDLGDGTTEVVVVSVWDSMQSIRAFSGMTLKPNIDPAIQHKLFDREPTVRHYAMSDLGGMDALPPDWRKSVDAPRGKVLDIGK